MSKSINVPKLRFKEFSGEWQHISLKDIASIVGGGTPDTTQEDYWNGEIQWFTPTEIKSKYIKGSNRTITELGLKKSSAKVLPQGTLLLSSRATVGDVGIAVEECTTNQGFQSLIVNDNNSNEFFYNWIIMNKNEFIKRASGSTFLEISKKEIEKIKAYKPSKQEQEKIASFLTSVDTKIEQLTKKEQLLQQYKKSVMQKIFNQEIRFKADDGSEFCDWGEKKVDDILKTVSTKLYQIKSSDILSEGLFKVVDQGQKTIAGYSNDTEKVYSSGDIIVYGDHTTIVKYIDFDFIVGADGTKLLNTTKDNNLKYMYYNLVFNNIEAEGYKRHFSILRNITLQIPSLKEQTKIANFLSSIDKKIENTKNQLEQTKEFKKALLQQIFV